MVTRRRRPSPPPRRLLPRKSPRPLPLAPPIPRSAALAEKANTILKPLPTSAPNPENEGTQAKIDLGRMLYYDTRFSKNQDIACNSCHKLDAYRRPTTSRPRPATRAPAAIANSPTVYNAALHIAQFWTAARGRRGAGEGAGAQSGRDGDALGRAVVAILDSDSGLCEPLRGGLPRRGESHHLRQHGPGNRSLRAQPDDAGPPRRLHGGDLAALSEQERRGLETFFAVGCNSCHTGPALGGQLYRKLGFVFAYETKDPGREKVTGDPADRHVFKVPSLRNVAKTGPWFHDGSITSLEEVVRLMGYHQVGVTLEPAQIADIVAFLGALTGEVDAAYIAKPTLPESGPEHAEAPIRAERATGRSFGVRSGPRAGCTVRAPARPFRNRNLLS